jgi:N-acetylmuramoyl-L-alanine amidase
MPVFKKLIISLSAALLFGMLMSGAALAETTKTGVVTEDSVNFRSSPDTSAKILDQLNKGTKVSILASEGDWFKVSYNDASGWINDQFLTVRDEKTAVGAVTENNVNVRSKPNTSSEIMTKLDKGAKVDIYEHSGDWYRVSIGEERYGWINGDYVKLDDEKTSRGVVEDAVAAVDAAVDESLDIRQQIVSYAKKLLGVRYVSGGYSTKGFDCSGFVGYVLDRFGISHERTAADLSQSGTSVKREELLPGDLIFFDTNGGHNSINHVGIYIGNNKFIHASSYLNRKVTISSLGDGYYSKRYMKAKDYLS